MSWWTDVRDVIEQVATGGMYDPKASRRNEAEQRYLVNDQIKAYKEQTALSRAELDKTRAEQAVEKRRIQEKQIRSLRRNYRASGILGTSQPTQPDMTTKLGG